VSSGGSLSRWVEGLARLSALESRVSSIEGFLDSEVEDSSFESFGTLDLDFLRDLDLEPYALEETVAYVLSESSFEFEREWLSIRVWRDRRGSVPYLVLEHRKRPAFGVWTLRNQKYFRIDEDGLLWTKDATDLRDDRWSQVVSSYEGFSLPIEPPSDPPSDEDDRPWQEGEHWHLWSRSTRWYFGLYPIQSAGDRLVMSLRSDERWEREHLGQFVMSRASSVDLSGSGIVVKP